MTKDPLTMWESITEPKCQLDLLLIMAGGTRVFFWWNVYDKKKTTKQIVYIVNY